jgi:RNA polymerase sigma-54 factor
MYPRLSFRTKLNIGPQLVLAGQLLRYSLSDIEQSVNQELAENPALELANEQAYLKEVWKLSSLQFRNILQQKSTPGYQNGLTSSQSGWYESLDERLIAPDSAVDRLVRQAGLLLAGDDLEIAEVLLHSLDHRGYLVNPTAEIAAGLGKEPAVVERIIRTLHELDPPGIGARDTRECFLIQCQHLEAEGVGCPLARQIIFSAWPELLNQRWSQAAKKAGVSIKQVKQACEFIVQNLTPYPLSVLPDSVDNDSVLRYADLIIQNETTAGRPAFRVEIPGSEAFELKISDSFAAIMQAGSKYGQSIDENEKDWIRVHLIQAQRFIEALRQRWKTLRRIAEFLIQAQAEFLELGPGHIKPLTRKEVACQLNLHESTISRAISDKVVQLPNGRLMMMDRFFDASIGVKEAIKQILESEDCPKSDREIAEKLQTYGYSIARRTVAKYRRNLNSSQKRQNPLHLR